MAPPTVTLMQPILMTQPFHHKKWVYEEKVDGYRTVAQRDDGGVTLVGRQGKESTGRFSELARALASLPARSFILDGEVAVYDRARISRHEWLRARPKDGRATLPVYVVFDVLELDGKDWRPGAALEAAADRARAEALARPQTVEQRAQGVGADRSQGLSGAGGEGSGIALCRRPTQKWLKLKQPKYREGERGVYKP